MTKYIKISGQVAMVDNEDYDWISKFSWHLKNSGTVLYARCNVVLDNKHTTMTMHRMVMTAKKGQIVDHIDRNGLNNQKYNLRFATKAQNKMNCISHKNSSSKYKGVHWNKVSKVWQSRIQFEGKKIFLGAFDNEIEAARAYDKKSIEIFGEYSRVNLKGES